MVTTTAHPHPTASVATSRRPGGLLAALLASLLATGGCGPPLDRYADVHDLRVLAIRAEPPELLDSPLAPQITFEALVVDPRYPDEPIDLRWEMCPVESSRACNNYDERIDTAYETLDELSAVVEAPPVDVGGGGPPCPLSPDVVQGFTRFAQVLGEMSERTYLDRYRDPIDADRLVLATERPGQAEPAGDVSARTVDLRFLRPMAEQMRACDLPVPTDAELAALPTEATDLHLFHLLTSPLESLLGVWPTAVLTARGVDDTVVAQKRLVLGWRQPSGPLAVFRLFAPTLDFGVPVCPPGAPSSAGACLSAGERVPNHNPVFADVRVGRGNARTAIYQSVRVWPDLGRQNFRELREAARQAQRSPPMPYERRFGFEPPPPQPPPPPLELEVVELAAGESVRILPVFTEDSFEPYQSVRVDPDDQTLTVTDEVEEISVSWFATGGRVAEALTWPTLTVGHDTRYTAPPDPPPAFDRDIRLWMVARDQRGGTTWQELRIRIVD